MSILITGAKGFVGKNLVASLKSIQENKDRTHSELQIEEIYEYDVDSESNLLEEYCAKADFVFNIPQLPTKRKGIFSFKNECG